MEKKSYTNILIFGQMVCIFCTMVFSWVDFILGGGGLLHNTPSGMHTMHTPYNKYLKLAQERTPGIPYITHSFSPPTSSGMHTPHTPCNNCLKQAQERIPRISHKTNAFSPPTPLGYACPAYPI